MLSESGMIHLVSDEPVAHPPDQGGEGLPHHDRHGHRVALLLNNFANFSSLSEVTHARLSLAFQHFCLLIGTF